jgi:hypothetical protein
MRGPQAAVLESLPRPGVSGRSMPCLTPAGKREIKLIDGKVNLFGTTSVASFADIFMPAPGSTKRFRYPPNHDLPLCKYPRAVALRSLGASRGATADRGGSAALQGHRGSRRGSRPCGRQRSPATPRASARAGRNSQCALLPRRDPPDGRDGRSLLCQLHEAARSRDA